MGNNTEHDNNSNRSREENGTRKLLTLKQQDLIAAALNYYITKNIALPPIEYGKARNLLWLIEQANYIILE